MKVFKKHVISAILLSAFIVLGAGSIETDRDANNVANSQTDYVITADSLYQAYNENQVAADAKYGNKIIRVSGYIQMIGKDVMDIAYLVIGGEGFLDGVQCMFPESQENLVASVSKGQYVTLKGRVSGQVFGNVVVRNCTFTSDN